MEKAVNCQIVGKQVKNVSMQINLQEMIETHIGKVARNENFIKVKSIMKDREIFYCQEYTRVFE